MSVRPIPVRSRAALLVLVLSPLRLSGAETVRYVPAVAHAPGAGGTSWSTDLSLFNPSVSRPLAVSLAFLPAGGDNLDARSVTVTVEPRRGLLLADVVRETFGAAGGGGLRLSCDGSLVATSRTFTGSSGGGTFGLGVPSVGIESATSKGVLVVAAGDGFRVNAGFLNPARVAVRVSYVAKDVLQGTTLAQATVDLPPFGFAQVNGLAPAASGLVALETTSTTSSDACGCAPIDCCRVPSPVFSFATVIDDRSGDATYALAEADAAEAPASGYLMSFLGCEGDSGPGGRCNDPRDHRVYVARSPDGVSWSVLPGWQPFPGSVPDVVRRGSTLYLYTPGQLTRYHLDTGRLDASVSVAFRGPVNPMYVDPSATFDETGRLTLFFLYGRQGSDPAGCPPGTATCTQRFGSATEVPGSDGAEFEIDAGDRVTIPIGQGQPYTGASDPDVFFDGTRWIVYVSHGSNTSVWASPALRGTYTKVIDLVSNQTGGIASGHYDAASRRYWTYAHLPRNGVQIIRRAVHADLTRPLQESDWTNVVTGPLVGLPATLNVASPGFCLDVP